ncbi:MAG TPA: SPOR domain-containing protein [Xanthomonadales bacterium]|nr:SPOR domain-containing protein [Xanthomonadales bacterium]
MILRICVLGLVAFNILLIGWALLQPELSEGPASDAADQISRINSLPAIRLASEATGLVPGGSQSSRQCFTLGPLASRSALERIREELENAVINLDWHETTSLVEQGYWVYLEPFSSYEQAAEAVEQLIANGVTDYFVMPDGTFANAISVGLYEQRAQAQTRKDSIDQLGLGWPVAIEMQREDETRFWLDFEVRSDADIEVESLIDENKEARHLEVPCPENEASFPPT